MSMKCFTSPRHGPPEVLKGSRGV
uniref:Uncharacterized protein n=1 Tax=Anguilla anguilla TaxID=7936 RepID=A0A0E9PJ23_ANGAN